jgi:TonB family protein
MIFATLVIAMGTLLGVGTPAPAPQNAPLRISSVVMQTKLIKAEPPKYPEKARKKNIQGVVTLEIVIGRNGHVKSEKVTDGPKELRKSAVNSVKHWVYQPTRLKGKPVEVETSVKVGFKLLPPKKKKEAKGKPQS